MSAAISGIALGDKMVGFAREEASGGWAAVTGLGENLGVFHDGEGKNKPKGKDRALRALLFHHQGRDFRGDE